MNDINQDIEYSRRGPWDTPLKEYNKSETPIVVIIHDLTKNEDQDTFESCHRINYASWEDRKFLGKLSFWAYNNRRSVETMTVEEWEKMNK